MLAQGAYINENEWIYFEKQESKLCGQHCLNNLVQGSYFSAPDLADIAAELDESERRLGITSMMSHHVDETGNFSIEVLRTAMEKFYGVKLIHSDSKSTTSTEEAFVINRHDHWLTCRKIGKEWYDLNSMLEQPEHIGEYKLDAYLAKLRNEGYTVFIVKGNLPKPTGQGKDPNWIKKSELVNNSMNGFSGGNVGGVINSSVSDQPKFTAFSGSGNRLDGRSNNSATNVSTGNMTEEEMIAQAIAMSLQENTTGDTADTAAAAAAAAPMSAKERMRAERMAALEKRGLK